MSPTLAIRIGTALVFFVGFCAGWWWRGRRDSERAAELFGKLSEHDGPKE